jgi:adenylate cyclase
MGHNQGMQYVAFDRLYRRLGRHYVWAFVAFDVFTAYVVCVSTLGLFALYEDMSKDEFWRIFLVADVCVAAGLGYGFVKARGMTRGLLDWVGRGRRKEGALEAWHTAVSLPREFAVANGWRPFVIVALPVAIYIPLELELPFWTAPIIFAGTVVAAAYSAILHFFAAELFLRPVVEDICKQLPPEFAGRAVGVPLRWKLLGALPLINVITGVVVSGLSTDGDASLEDLGLDVLVALAVAFTISFELTLLLAKSILRPVDDLLEATNRVKRGDLDARVPLTSGDEIGTLAGSFNEMMQGLSEREALREAFGSYVDPDVAERVLDEGELLEGQEREVTVMFVDIRDFTAFADRSSARETVAFLSDFFDSIVPIIRKHGGNANKFLGDGVLAVFGAPERLPDHADRALAAACETVDEVERRFDGIRIGIGLNSGPVVVGSVGGGGRLEFTVIGDPVNVAARVESASRETGDVVLLTEATRCLLEGEHPDLEPRGEVPLKGKAQPVQVYSARPLDERTIPEAPSLTADA